jgi:hypothetical protein
MALALAEAKGKASRIAKTLEKRLGAVKHISAMVFHSPEDFTRCRRTPLLGRESCLSVSPDQVEVPGKVTVGFELLD